MLVLDIMSFKDLAIRLLGELSPSMWFLYDIFAGVFGFIFVMIVYSLFNVTFKALRRW